MGQRSPLHREASHRAFLRLAARAAEKGATLRPGAVLWHASANCQAPVYREQAYASAKASGNVYLEMWVRCRRCAACLKQRAREWRNRALSELKASTRTWFVTLTLEPARRFQCAAKAEYEALQRGVRWSDLTVDQKASRIGQVIGREVTLFIKRLRKNTGVTFRYLLVMETHKDGFPHFHMLLHEVDQDQAVRHRHFAECWRWGFSNAKLVAAHDEKIPAYVSKYISKTLFNRVRASRGYGVGAPNTNIASAIAAATAASVQTGCPSPQSSASAQVSAPAENTCFRNENHAIAWLADFIAHIEGATVQNGLSGSIQTGLSNVAILEPGEAARWIARQASALPETPKSTRLTAASLRSDLALGAGSVLARAGETAALRKKETTTGYGRG